MRKIKTVALGAVIVLAMGMLSGCGKSDIGTMKRFSKCADVTDYKGVEYVPESREVTQDEIDDAIDSFCNDNSVTTQDKTSEIASSDVVNIDYVEKISGVEHDRQSDYEITIGNDEIIPGFDEQIIGEKGGSIKKFKLTYPDDYEDTQVAGLEAEFEVTVNYISVTTIPEYNDELVKKATDGEYTTTADYTKHLTEELQNDRNDEADEAERTAVLQTIIDKTEIKKYPQNEADEYTKSVIQNMESAAQNYQIDLQTYLMYFYGYDNEADFMKFLTETVESVMKEKIVVSSIAYKENLVATDDDIAAYKKELMEKNDIEDEATIDEYYNKNDLEFYATEEKVLDFLMENAVQVEEKTEDTEDASTEE